VKKEEAEESANANQQTKAKEWSEELKLAFLASQQKLWEVNAEVAKLNAKYKKLLKVCNIWIKMQIKNLKRHLCSSSGLINWKTGMNKRKNFSTRSCIKIKD
jgi:hypothetical protein